MAERELGAPEYRVEGFAITEPLALWWEFLPAPECRRIDPDGKLATLFHNRRELLTRASRVERRLLSNLPVAALIAMHHNGKLGWLISHMDQVLNRLVGDGQAATPEAHELAAALIRTEGFARQCEYEPEMIGTLFGLERFGREQKRAAADQPHG
ncbi:hypothetical protein HY442_00950 [Candidatus Parcubacteria bacterium]|nr:hypothetical protein [Candidatus Parcubacteria bacterium]MBI4385495.1 hypothetical protein [Candidatus Parcubacteria bacterium]